MLFVNVEGETVVYIKGENIVAKSLFNEDLVLINEGDSVTIEYYEEAKIIEANSVVLK